MGEIDEQNESKRQEQTILDQVYVEDHERYSSELTVLTGVKYSAPSELRTSKIKVV